MEDGRARALPRIAGHKEGINSVREITRVCGEIGVKHLTLYTFLLKIGRDHHQRLVRL